MPKEHLGSDEFFERLSELFDEGRKKDHGSIYLTQKCMSYDSEPSQPLTSGKPFPDQHASNPLPIILRATNGKTNKETKSKEGRIKLSTIVEADALEGFFTRYAEVCKAGMSGLKKRDRSKGKKKLKAKKKKGGAVAGGEDVKKS